MKNIYSFRTLRCMSSYPSSQKGTINQLNRIDHGAGSHRKKITLHSLRKLYDSNIPIAVMTAHDYPSGSYVERAEMDICLVGDSLAMVTLGFETTNEITLDQMMHHSRAVARGLKHPFLVGDMPFGSYESTHEQAIKNAIRYVSEGKVEAVKLEGGIEMAETISRITKIGIPVMGHVGLTPQRQTSLGGFKVQGKTFSKAKTIFEDALALQEAGCFSIVLEAIPEPVATFITKKLHIPTIGIGAGPGCSGQVLVQLDALKGHHDHIPKFCHGFADLGTTATQALKDYRDQVKSRSFPISKQHTYGMAPGEEEKLQEWLAELESRETNTI